METFIQGALRALRETTGIDGRILHFSPLSDTGDAHVVVELCPGAHRVPFRVVTQPAVRASHLARLRAVPEREAPTLVMTRHVSRPLAHRMKEHGLQFIDHAGNAYLDTGDWFVFTVGAKARRPRAKKPRSLSPATWKVAFALLRHPEAANFTVRQLAEHAGTSSAAAHSALQALQERGWVEDLGRGRQAVRLSQPSINAQ